jgi:hypothetical protein
MCYNFLQMKKVHIDEVICLKLLRVSTKGEGKLQYFTRFLPITFLLAKFSQFTPVQYLRNPIFCELIQRERTNSNISLIFCQ